MTPRPTTRREDVGGTMPTVTSWVKLTRPDRVQVLLDLDQWVRWLARDYEIPAATIPECWPLHPRFVHELLAIRDAWLFCYMVDEQGAHAAEAWHRGLASCLARLAEFRAANRCGDKISNHQPLPVAYWLDAAEAGTSAPSRAMEVVDTSLGYEPTWVPGTHAPIPQEAILHVGGTRATIDLSDGEDGR